MPLLSTEYKLSCLTISNIIPLGHTDRAKNMDFVYFYGQDIEHVERYLYVPTNIHPNSDLQ